MNASTAASAQSPKTAASTRSDLDPQREHHAEAAENEHREQLGEPVERVLRLLRVDAEQGALEEAERQERDPDRERGPVEAWTAADDDRNHGEAEEEEGERREAERERGEPDRGPAPAELEGLERREPRGERRPRTDTSR